MLQTLKKYWAPYLFILPFFILFFIFQLIPTIWTIYISLTDWKGIGSPKFCGLSNYPENDGGQYVLGISGKHGCLLDLRPDFDHLLRSFNCLPAEQPFSQ